MELIPELSERLYSIAAKTDPSRIAVYAEAGVFTEPVSEHLLERSVHFPIALAQFEALSYSDGVVLDEYLLEVVQRVVHYARYDNSTVDFMNGTIKSLEVVNSELLSLDLTPRARFELATRFLAIAVANEPKREETQVCGLTQEWLSAAWPRKVKGSSKITPYFILLEAAISGNDASLYGWD